MILLLLPIAIGYAHFMNEVHELSARKRIAEVRNSEMNNGANVPHGFFADEVEPAALNCIDDNKQELKMQFLKTFVVRKHDLNTEQASVTRSFTDHALHSIPLNETDDFIYFIESLLL
jgi:hypothetical protein